MYCDTVVSVSDSCLLRVEISSVRTSGRTGCVCMLGGFVPPLGLYKYEAYPYRAVGWRLKSERGGNKETEHVSKAALPPAPSLSSPSCNHTNIVCFHTLTTSLCSLLTPPAHVHSSCHGFFQHRQQFLHT